MFILINLIIMKLMIQQNFLNDFYHIIHQNLLFCLYTQVHQLFNQFYFLRKIIYLNIPILTFQFHFLYYPLFFILNFKFNFLFIHHFQVILNFHIQIIIILFIQYH